MFRGERAVKLLYSEATAAAVVQKNSLSCKMMAIKMKISSHFITKDFLILLILKEMRVITKIN